MKQGRWKMLLGALAANLAFGAAVQARDVTVQWNANTETNLAGYKVYYRSDSSALPFNGTGSGQGASPVNVAKQTSATLTGLDPAKTYYFAVTAYDTAGTESTYSNIVSVAEGVAPSVSITSPSSGSTASGTVSVTAGATDNVGVSKLEFYVNGVLAATDTTTPYVYSWNTAGLAAGSYTLMAKAYDAAGNVGQSGSVAVTVAKDSTAPTVSLSSPTAGSTLTGSTVVRASASDNLGVSKVEFYDNGALLSATNVAPYTYTWNTALAANGAHALTARAYDAAGNVGQSATVNVTVNNSAPSTTVSTAIFGNGTGATYSNTVEDTYLNINTEQNSTGLFLNAYTWPARTPANSILMKWNLASLPAGAQIQSATLSLYQTGWNGDASYAMPVAKIINKNPTLSRSTGYTYDGTNSWSASSIPYGGVPLAQSDMAAPADTPLVNNVNGSYKNWNVTSIVKDWIANPAANYGLAINSSNGAAADSSRTFVSSESANAGQRPKLTITYTLSTTTPAPAPAPAPAPVISNATIWPAGTVPSVVDAGADNSVELGVKFRSDVSGYIKGIRFYKSAANTGSHTASLWTAAGARLATATFTGETASGWQQVNFSTPVAITANTVYVASYHAPVGHYAGTANYFTGTGADSGPLHALASGVSGTNGVYAYGSGTVFPNQSYNDFNYWVDVVFSQ